MSALAFDLDGTLVSCRERQVAVAETVAAPLDPDAFWAAKQDGRTTAEALTAQGIEQPEQAARAWVDRIEEEHFLALDRLAAGALEALLAAQEAGLAPVILTARRDAAAVGRQVEWLGLVPPATGPVVVDPRRAGEEKAVALAELDAVGLVGDTESDLAAARTAGVPFAAVDGGQRSAAFLNERGAEQVHPDVLSACRALIAAIRR